MFIDTCKEIMKYKLNFLLYNPNDEYWNIIYNLISNTKLFFFIAPEMKDDVYTEKADVFLFGALIYYILNLGIIPKMNVYDYIQCKAFEILKHSLNSLEN